MKREVSTSGGVLCWETKCVGRVLSSGKSSGGVGDTCAHSLHRHTGCSPGQQCKTGVEITSPWSIQLQEAGRPWDSKRLLSS